MQHNCPQKNNFEKGVCQGSGGFRHKPPLPAQPHLETGARITRLR